jgi:hypothetical protein
MQESSQTQHVQGDQRLAEIIFYMQGAPYREPQRASHQRNPRGNSPPVAAKKRNPNESAATIPTPEIPAGSGLLHALRPRRRAINLILPGSRKPQILGVGQPAATEQSLY